jgi:hypothetical protein
MVWDLLVGYGDGKIRSTAHRRAVISAATAPDADDFTILVRLWISPSSDGSPWDLNPTRRGQPDLRLFADLWLAEHAGGTK